MNRILPPPPQWLFVTILVLALILVLIGRAGAKDLCLVEPNGTPPDWHYRTKVDGRPDKCWYLGPRMKPRSDLYWAEVPAAPEKAKSELEQAAPRLPTPVEIRTPQRPSWELSPRWVDPRGWTHQE